MLALIAGTGGLPVAVAARLSEPPLICAMRGFAPDLTADLTFRLEHLGSFLDTLVARGVTEVCFAGGVRRPQIDPSEIDDATKPLVPRIMSAIAQGDDAALRIVIALFEERGLKVRAAHDVAPDLLATREMSTGRAVGDALRKDAHVGEACVAALGAKDQGQACVIKTGTVIAREGPEGTAAMIAGLVEGTGAVLFKAPKPTQDLRADLPVIGAETILEAAAAGLAGIVIEMGGVMVLDQDRVQALLDAHDLFLWVRPRGAA